MRIQKTNSTQSFGGLGGANKILSKAANINSWQQRAALGVAAMTLQPFIDLRNKDVEKETRRVSANRSFAKALVGMSTGILVRSGCMKGIEKLLKKDSLSDKLAKLTAENTTKEAIEKSRDFIKNQGGAKRYASVIGTIAALGVMVVTNFLVDVPLTNWLTNKMNKKYEENPNAKTGENQ